MINTKHSWQEKALAFVIYFALSIPLWLLQIHVTTTILTLFHINFFTRIQIAGIIVVKNLLFFKYKAKDKNDKEDSPLNKTFTDLGISCLALLIFWGMAYISYWVITTF